MSASFLNIVITKKADADETAIYEYITTSFGSVYADNFRKKLIGLFNLISRQPFIGRPARNDASIRVFQMSRQNKIVYKLNDTEIIVLRILHTRMKISGEF